MVKLKEVAGVNTTAASTEPATEISTHTESLYNKENPYTATLLNSHPLVTDNAERTISHIEIDLDESGLQYQVGDALGVVTNNPGEVVEEVLECCGLSGAENIDGRTGSITIREALIEQCDLNQLPPKFLKDYADTVSYTHLTLPTKA